MKGPEVADRLPSDAAADPGTSPRTLQDFYADKNDQYFEGLRADMIADLPLNPGARILEIGCGLGATGEACLATGRAGYYCGVELDRKAAAVAAKRITQVHCGNVEQIDPAVLGGDYDALIMSEVLEHLFDPWGVVAALVPKLRPGALVFASSPNVSHKNVVRALLKGRFDYQAVGVMDRTHVRWFTPATYREMFEQAGLETLAVGPLAPVGRRAVAINAITGGRFAHLFVEQIMYRGLKPPGGG
jgi:2-polyprenyl-3-methyl-5-hydroxy-6-metoxy-1,4-benzoquinol methylase